MSTESITQDPQPAALDTGAAARYLGVSESWLEKQRLRSGGPPYCQLGRRCVYRRESLDAWLKGREVGAEPAAPVIDATTSRRGRRGAR